MLSGLVGFTAIDVSLCAPTPSQSVSTLAVVWVGVVQIAVPGLAAGALPKTALVTGAGASLTLWAKSIGCGSSSALAAAPPTAVAIAAVVRTSAARQRAARPRDSCTGAPFGRPRIDL